MDQIFGRVRSTSPMNYSPAASRSKNNFSSPSIRLKQSSKMLNSNFGMTESVPSTIKEEEIMQNGKLRVLKKN